LSSARPFKPAQRLRQKTEFDRVYRDARRSADALFAIFARNTGAAAPRLGLAIAARIVGNAVRRNRIKRLIRESFRQHQHELPAVDLVVNARAGARDADNAAITRSLERPDPRLPLLREPDARAELPFLSELFLLRRRSDRASRHRARQLSRCTPHPALSSVASRRLRPGAAALFDKACVTWITNASSSGPHWLSCCG
jgi:ribonuclease P protein component